MYSYSTHTIWIMFNVWSAFCQFTYFTFWLMFNYYNSHVSFLSHIQRLQYPSHYLNQVKILLSVFESSSVNDIQYVHLWRLQKHCWMLYWWQFDQHWFHLSHRSFDPVLNNSNASTYLHFNCSKMSLYIVLKVPNAIFSAVFCSWNINSVLLSQCIIREW